MFIDLNMVRAGVVNPPLEWSHGGYRQILNPPKRYSIIDQKALMNKCGFKNIEQFRNDYQGWVEAATRNRKPTREPVWSESLEVGSETFIENIKKKLGIKAKGRKTVIQMKKDSNNYYWS